MELIGHRKADTKAIIGIEGTKSILKSLATTRSKQLFTVAIGGISKANVQDVIFQSATTFRSLDGVAVISAVIAAQDPKSATVELLGLVKQA